MPSLLTILLSDLHFFAFHGLYASEKKTGNEFVVNLSVSFPPDDRVITGLGHSINYVNLYALLKKEMQQPRELLETFVMEVVEKIHATYPRIKKIEISINKLHPPIAAFTGSVGVAYAKEF